MLVDSICQALEAVDPNVIQLSLLRYDGRPKLVDPIYQERVFAYEFYHQFRKLQEAKKIDFHDLVLQAEVSKDYQGTDKIPDFLLHIPNSRRNSAVLEFKLASNGRIVEDLKKLQQFSMDPFRYEQAFMVIVDNLTKASTIERELGDALAPDGYAVQLIIVSCARQVKISSSKEVFVNFPDLPNLIV